jgi:hypothetical protein
MTQSSITSIVQSNTDSGNGGVIVDVYLRNPVNVFRNMIGVISYSRVHGNELILQLTNGDFNVLDLEQK